MTTKKIESKDPSLVTQRWKGTHCVKVVGPAFVPQTNGFKQSPMPMSGIEIVSCKA